MARTRPWLRLDAQYDRDGKLRRAGAVAIWPLVLCRLKPGSGRCSADDIEADLLAADVGLPLELVEPMVEGLFRVGLLERDGDDVTTPGWGRYQPVDARPHSSERKPAQQAYSQKLPPSPKVPNLPDSPNDGTGRDRTKTRKAVVVDSEVARAHEGDETQQPTEHPSWSDINAVLMPGGFSFSFATPPDKLAELMVILRDVCIERRECDLEEWQRADILVHEYGLAACKHHAGKIRGPVADRPVNYLQAILKEDATSLHGDAWKLKWQQ